MVAIAIVLDVAFHAGRSGTVSGLDIAERLGEARRGIEPLLQSLSRAGIFSSTRGPKGGYRLGRAARDITLEAILAAGSGDGEEEAPAAGPSPLQQKVIAPLRDELDATLREALSKITVAELLRRATAAGLRRPAVEPLNFAI